MMQYQNTYIYTYTLPPSAEENMVTFLSNTIEPLYNITRVASWGPYRRKWLFSEVRDGICADKDLRR